MIDYQITICDYVVYLLVIITIAVTISFLDKNIPIV